MSFNHCYYILYNESCALFLSRYTTVAKLQQSYLFIPNKYKVIVDLNWSTCTCIIYFWKLLLPLYIAKTVIIVNTIVDVAVIPANVISYLDLKINTNQLVHR